MLSLLLLVQLNKEQQNKNQNHVIESVKEFSKAKYKVDIFKLESPVDSSKLEDGKFTKATHEAFKKLSLATKDIPWVMLSSGMSRNSFYNCLTSSLSFSFTFSFTQCIHSLKVLKDCIC